MKEFWDQRFGAEAYVYGEEPNIFVKDFIDSNTPGNALFPGEGEGRNGVYAARQGWKVFAFDYSGAGRKKALELAQKHGVNIEYDVADVDSYDYKTAFFDAAVICFLHLPADKRNSFWSNIYECLQPGGRIFAILYHIDQIHNGTGGPKNVELLYSTDQLKHELAAFSKITMQQKTVHLEEGQHHVGQSEIIITEAVK